jgi:hypothetical protein
MIDQWSFYPIYVWCHLFSTGRSSSHHTHCRSNQVREVTCSEASPRRILRLPDTVIPFTMGLAGLITVI